MAPLSGLLLMGRGLLVRETLECGVDIYRNLLTQAEQVRKSCWEKPLERPESEQGRMTPGFHLWSPGRRD
jgi:hypothetical protein